MASLKRQIGVKKAVAIVGMAQTSRHLAPWNVDNVDIWVLNESHAHNYLKRISRIFQLHPEWDFMRRGNFNDPFYPEFIQNLPWTEEDVERLKNTNVYKKMPRGWNSPKVGEKRRPDDIEVMLLEDYEIVNATRKVYPFKPIMDSYKNNKHTRYFTSSAPYMIALALHEEYEWIGVFGFEMSSREEYAYQKPCMEFWLGRAMERIGDENVYLPPGCQLLGQTTELYGYDKVPGYTGMHAEIRKNGLGRDRNQAQIQFNNVSAQISMLQTELQQAVNAKDKAWIKRVEKKLGNMMPIKDKALAELNVKHGAFMEADYTWRQIQALPTTEEIKPIVPGK